MQLLYSSTTPLAGGAQAISPWLSVSACGEWPYLLLSIQSDQAGSVLVQEDENPTNESESQTILLAAVPAGLAFQVGGITSRRYFRVVYTNGPVAQASFSLSATDYPSDSGSNPLDQHRQLELILRESRLTNLLLAKLSEPTSSKINLPIGSNLTNR